MAGIIRHAGYHRIEPAVVVACQNEASIEVQLPICAAALEWSVPDAAAPRWGGPLAWNG